ncbi:MAG: class I SAM-dependent methyltransferase [Acaryochloridaceae cyanobacterium RU_4_10]|nr:class I SAM-dependent methyltransferase [Acaryochloridaceae cyanobacterium RU_4_10]
MATILRTWSYRYPWLYDGITKVTALSVGGEARLRRLALQSLDLQPDMQILDLCCGNGPVTQVLAQLSHHVTGLDASPKAIARAQQNVPQATFVEAFAEAMPFGDASFDVVHTSMALHEMEVEQRDRILAEVFRVLKPGGIFTLIDFHQPSNPIFWPGLALFLWLFETETAWQLIQTNLTDCLLEKGFALQSDRYPVGGSLQIIQAQKPI